MKWNGKKHRLIHRITQTATSNSSKQRLMHDIRSNETSTSHRERCGIRVENVEPYCFGSPPFFVQPSQATLNVREAYFLDRPTMVTEYFHNRARIHLHIATTIFHLSESFRTEFRQLFSFNSQVLSFFRPLNIQFPTAKCWQLLPRQLNCNVGICLVF